MTKFVYLVFGLLLFTSLAEATETTEANTEQEAPDWIVEVSANDDLPLFGDYYNYGDGRPTVVLLHQLYTTRASWGTLVWTLVENGYNVLAVDMRGSGQTGGGIDWTLAVDDLQVWLDWLREQPGVYPDTISVVGSSIGSSLALVGCANDSQCSTAIAISPGWDYYRVRTVDAFADDFGERAVLLVLAEHDYWPAVGVPQILDAANNPVEVQSYPGNDHGMTLFETQAETLIPLIIDWLDHNGR